MNLRNKILATVAAALSVAGPASAAVNPDAVHVALDSLLLAVTKMAVANTILASPKLPSNNTEAHLSAPDKMRSNEINSILVTQGAVINVYLSPVTGTQGGIVQYVPQLVKTEEGKRAVRYVCYSPNIPVITKIAPDCTYHAAGK